MGHASHDPRHDALGDYWDALVNGLPVPADGDLGPAFRETIQRLRRLDDARAPDADFVTRLEREIMGTTITADGFAAVVPNPRRSGAANGHRVAATPIRASPPRALPRRPWLASFATAALVLLTLLGSFLAVRGPLHPGEPNENPAVIPAWEGTPEPTLPPRATEDTVLLQGTFDSIPSGADFGGIKRAVLQPGAKWPLGSDAEDGEGPFLYVVESGALTINAEGSIVVTRAGSATPKAMPAQRDVVLQAGDQGFTQSGVHSVWRNDGATPVSVLTVMVASDGRDPRPPGVSYEDVVVAWPIAPPAAPVLATLHRITLSPDAAMPGVPGPGLKLLSITAGTAELVVGPANPLSEPTRTQRIAAPEGANVNTGQWTQPGGHLGQLGIGVDGIREVRNPGPDPLTLLMLTVVPMTDSISATPSTQSPEIALGVTETTLFDQTIDDAPDFGVWAGVEQTTLGPGAVMNQGTAATSGVGAMLYRVESGAVTGRAEGTAMVTRNGAGAATPVAAGSGIVLHPGDVAFVPSGVASRWENAGLVPAVVLDTGISGMGVDPRLVNGTPVPGWSEGNVLDFKAIIDSLPTGQVTMPAHLQVRRIALAPGARLTNQAEQGLAFLGVDSGTLTLASADPSDANGTRQMPAGSWIGVNDRSRDVMEGDPYPTREFRNDGDQPATFVLMTIAPAAAPAATPAADAFASDTLLHVTVPGYTIAESPEGTTIWLFSHYAVKPGERVQYSNDCSAPDFTVRYVLGGAYTAKPTGPMTVLRNASAGDGATREEVAAGQEVTLAAGDALAYRNTTNDDFAGFRNAGPDQLDILQWEWLEQDCLTSVPMGMDLQWDVWTRWSGSKPEWVQFDPTRPFEIRFRRMTAPPGTTLPQDGLDGPGFLPVGTPGLEVAGAEAGRVEVAAKGGARFPFVLTTIAPPGGQVASDASLAPGATRTIQSAGDEPLLLYDLVVTNTAVASPATPVTQAAGTPAARQADGVLFHQVLDSIPADAMWAGIERATIDPGKHWPQGSPQTTTGRGPMLYRVEQGLATLHTQGPIALTRAGATEPTPLAAGTDSTLQVGDVAYVPTDVLTDWRNEQSSPLVILDAGVANPWGVPAPYGVRKLSPIDADNLDIPATPAELTVRRLTLAPGQEVAGEPAPGLKLVGVDAGTITVDWVNRANPLAAAQNAGQSGSTPPGKDEYTAGDWVDVNRAGAFGNGADYVAATLRNDGTEPATLLMLTVVSLAPDATPAATPSANTPANGAGDTVLMQGTFETIPQDASWEGIERTTIPPGVEWPLGKSENDGEGPWLYRVESGALTINADGPIAVTRAGTSRPISIAPGTDVVLQPGDQGSTPSGVTSRWRNDGGVPAVVTGAGITTIGYGPNPAGLRHVTLTDAGVPLGTKAPVEVTVRRVTLSAAAPLSIDALPGLPLAYVESGEVEIVTGQDALSAANPLATRATPPPSLVVPAGQPLYVVAKGGYVRPAAGHDTATLLLMTVVAAGDAAATPAGS